MELVQEQELPQLGKPRGRMFRSGEPPGERRQKIGVVERPLALPVPALHRRLGGVRPPVVLEVELADDGREVLGVRLQRVEELVRGRHRRPRHALEVAHPPQGLEHLGRRPAAAVAVAEDEEAATRAVVILVVARAPAQLLDVGGRVIRVGRREVGEHLGAVDPLPRERVVRRRVEPVPGQLLGEEAADAGAAHDLGELAVVAEDVRVPELEAAAAELALEEALPVQKLAHERLAGRQVAVRLHPRAAHGHPAAGLGVAADPLVELGDAGADPVVLLGLRAREPELRVAVHVGGLRAERPHHLPLRLGQRPQPGRVDVGVADRGDLVDVRAVAISEQSLQDRLGLIPGSAVVLDPHVAEAVELGQELAGPRRVEPVSGIGLQAAQDVEVVVQIPRPAVEPGDRAAVEHDRIERGIDPRQLAELAVARQLDAQVELLPARRRVEHGRVDPGALRARVQTLHGAPADPERRLAVAHPQEVDPLAGPLVGHGRLHPEPVRRPQRTEAVAERGVAVVEPLCLLQRDAVDRPRDTHGVGRAHIGPDQGADPLADLGNAVARVLGMALHGPQH